MASGVTESKRCLYRVLSPRLTKPRRALMVPRSLEELVTFKIFRLRCLLGTGTRRDPGTSPSRGCLQGPEGDRFSGLPGMSFCSIFVIWAQQCVQALAVKSRVTQAGSGLVHHSRHVEFRCFRLGKSHSVTVTVTIVRSVVLPRTIRCCKILHEWCLRVKLGLTT
jgi:hypothetical protein